MLQDCTSRVQIACTVSTDSGNGMQKHATYIIWCVRGGHVGGRRQTMLLHQIKACLMVMETESKWT